MLSIFRNQVNGKFAKIFLFLLAASFIGWGAGDFFTANSNGNALSINDETVTLQELDLEYRKSVKKIEQSLNGDVPEQFSKYLKKQALQRVSQLALLKDVTNKLNVPTSDKELKASIIKESAFLDMDGNFDKELYTRILSTNGYSTEGYERTLRNELAQKRFGKLLESKFNDDEILNLLSDFYNETVDIQVLRINKKDIVTASVMPSESDLKELYTKNQRYTNELRSIDVLSIDINKISKSINVSKQEAKTIYDNDPESFIIGEQRRASHILVSDEETATSLIESFDKKDIDFASVAKNKSLDAFTKNKGGDLGFFAQEDIQAELADKAFSMKVGEISEPIKSSLGYHILTVTEIKEASTQTFAKVKKQIKADIIAEKADDIYQETLTQLEDEIAAGSPLNEIASKLDMVANLTSYSKVSVEEKAIKKLKSKFKEAETVVPLAFTLQKQDISDAIIINDSITQDEAASIYAQVTEIIAPRALTLNEVRKDLVAELKIQQIEKALTEQAKTALNKALKGSSLRSLAGSTTKNYKRFNNVSREGKNLPKWISASNASLLFNKKGVLANTVAIKDGLAVVKVVRNNKPNLKADQNTVFIENIATKMSNDISQQFMSYIYSKADLELNAKGIQQVLGEDISL